MNNYTICEIQTDNQFNDVINLWSSRKTIMRQGDNWSSLIDNIRAGTIVGAYNGSELVGTLKYSKWAGLPYYTISALYIKPDTVKRYDFSDANNPITYITDYILEKLENENYYTWYYIRILGKAYAKIQKEKNDLLNQTKLGYRYRRDIEEIVQPNTQSAFPVHNLILGSTTWARPVMIVRCSLENQYRKTENIFETEIEFLNAKKNTESY
jgi:hypothetical protein